MSIVFVIFFPMTKQDGDLSVCNYLGHQVMDIKSVNYIIIFFIMSFLILKYISHNFVSFHYNLVFITLPTVIILTLEGVVVSKYWEISLIRMRK